MNMNKSHRLAGLFALLFIPLLALSAHGESAKVQSVTVFGNEAFMISEVPQEFLGLYLYEKKGEPVIELEEDGKGSFQPHGRPKIPIKYWLKTDQNGKVERVENPNTGSYRVTLVLQYGENPDGNYRTDSYAMWYLTWDAEGRCFNILGERFKCP
jgi:hypothetical protein